MNYPAGAAVVTGFHFKCIFTGLVRKPRSTNIFGKFAEFAVKREVSRRIRRLPQMALGDVCRFYAHVGLDLLFEIRGYYNARILLFCVVLIGNKFVMNNGPAG